MKKAKLPTFSALRAPFYGSDKYAADFVVQVIGGKVEANYKNPLQTEYKNTCSIRVSRALNYSGAGIKRTVANVRVNSGGDDLWYIYSVSDMERYLRHMYGEPSINKKGKKSGDVTEADFAGAQGIILFKNYHVDLWNGAGCEGHCYFSKVSNVHALGYTSPVADEERARSGAEMKNLPGSDHPPDERRVTRGAPRATRSAKAQRALLPYSVGSAGS